MQTRTIYMTTKTIKNPLGDGRHDKASWRSVFEQSTIPAGTVFGVTDDGTISDHSIPKFEIAARLAGSLRDLLLQNCTKPLGFGEPPPPAEPATVKDAIAMFGGPEVVAEALCDALGIKPGDLRELMTKVVAPPSPQKAQGKSKAKGADART